MESRGGPPCRESDKAGKRAGTLRSGLGSQAKCPSGLWAGSGFQSRGTQRPLFGYIVLHRAELAHDPTVLQNKLLGLISKKKLLRKQANSYSSKRRP